jgi:hypothetical protein
LAKDKQIREAQQTQNSANKSKSLLRSIIVKRRERQERSNRKAVGAKNALRATETVTFQRKDVTP